MMKGGLNKKPRTTDRKKTRKLRWNGFKLAKYIESLMIMVILRTGLYLRGSEFLFRRWQCSVDTILHLLWNPNVHCRLYRCRPHLNPVESIYISSPHFFEMCFNFNLPVHSLMYILKSSYVKLLIEKDLKRLVCSRRASSPQKSKEMSKPRNFGTRRDF